jgi:citrate lyase subunit beta / citryl-CoA lyase
MDPRRSALFVPVGVEHFYPKAAASGADVVVLDLEDSVPVDRKKQARAQLGLARQAVRARRCAVRVNSEAGLIADDIAACAACAADELVLPKVESVADTMAARKLIARHPGWYPALSILVETMDAVRKIPALLQHGGPIASVALGMEDLSAQLLLSAPGRPGSADGLRWLHGQLLLWTAASATVPIGLLGELGNFSDTAQFERAAIAAWRAGYRGTYCIHPAQVPIANAAYAPDRADVEWSEAVVRAAKESERRGRGSAALAGTMIDAPTLRRAKRILDYQDAAHPQD